MTTGFGATVFSSWRRRSLPAWVVLMSLGRAAGARAEEPPTHRFVPPEKMYIADAFALREDGGELAYVTTDGAKQVALHIVNLGPDGKDVEIEGVGARVQALRWLGPGRVLVVTQAGPGTAGRRSGVHCGGARGWQHWSRGPHRPGYVRW